MTGRKKMAIGWVVLGGVPLAIFVGMEGYALSQPNPDDAITLSRFTFVVSSGWPPLVFLLGLATGILAEHFWRYLPIASPFDMAQRVPPAVRFVMLAIAWLIILVFTGGGVALFLAGFPAGELLTRLTWPWDPRDPKDRRG